MKLLIRFFLSAVAVYLIPYFLPGVHVADFRIALLVALVLGVINVTLKPLLILFTLPATVLTLGLFLFVINACMILLTSWLVPGFQVESFLWALLFSLLLSILTYLFQQLIS
jgi:putative membrane protein